MPDNNFLSPDPATYDNWYDTPRGQWIGSTELDLVQRLLQAQAGESLLDVGCGTGWFTRRYAQHAGLAVTGVDVDAPALAYARSKDAATHYLQADACDLPFASRQFDRVVSMTALCFVDDWAQAIRETIRVGRSRFVIGLLHLNSALYHAKGRNGGEGAYCGAHWHTTDELKYALAGMDVSGVEFHTAIFAPSGTRMARTIERILPNECLWGGCLIVSGNIKERS